MFGYDARAMWIVVIFAILIALYLVRLIYDKIRGKSIDDVSDESKASEKSDLDHIVNFDTNWNDTPWVSDKEDKSAAEELFEKAYAVAPRRSNVQRIIFQEHKINEERKKAVVDRDKSED